MKLLTMKSNVTYLKVTDFSNTAFKTVYIGEIPESGKIQVYKNGAWIDMSKPTTITYDAIKKGEIRYITTTGESGTGIDTFAFDIDGGVKDSVKITKHLTEIVTVGQEQSTHGNNLANTIHGNDAKNLIFGGDGNDALYGYAGNDILDGGNGNDTLNGGAGIDVMYGGNGNDTYYVDDVGDIVTEYTNQGIDTVIATGSFVLRNNVENLTLKQEVALNGNYDSYGYGNELNNIIIGTEIRDTLRGEDGNDTLKGGAGNDTLDGGNGNDILDGGAGADTLEGGAGNDTYYVDNERDIVNEKLGQGIDTIITTVSYELSENVENLTSKVTKNDVEVFGNSLNNTINGSIYNDIIDGKDGNDTLNGDAGNDVLFGGNGNDVLNGGAGNDTLYGGEGNDIYYVDNAKDVIYEKENQGTDVVVSSVSYALTKDVENLTLSGSANINGIGNALKNTIIGNSGNNIINGGAGADTLEGGAGNDTYYVDNVKDSVMEFASQGTDTVISSVVYALTSNVENLTLTGSSNLSGTGNALNNVINGNTGNNILNGGAGNDTLNGGLGNDTLYGGAGKDTFVFNTKLNASTNKDTIKDFNVADDTISLENAIFTKLTATGMLNKDFFKVTTDGKAKDSNDYIVYNKNNGQLFYDADGSGKGAAVLFAVVENKANLTNADFTVI